MITIVVAVRLQCSILMLAHRRQEDSLGWLSWSEALVLVVEAGSNKL